MANVDAVPAGKYGKAALEKLSVWDSVKDKIAQADNVRAALLLVSRGEAPLGIVYQTDAAADPTVKIIGTFPEDSHPPITYPVALTKTSTNPDAQAFFTYIRSPAAKPAFERQGFTVLGPGGGAALTPVGEQVVELYRAIESRTRSSANGEFRALSKLIRRVQKARA
jgi:molybdate transport system substrate-binding protein